MISTYLSFRCSALPEIVRCPVSDVAGPVHYFDIGTGVFVSWDVLGDPDSRREVCAACAAGSWQ